MRCPFCSEDDDRVVDSRLTDDGTAIRRRRACNACSKRFTTYERAETEEQLRVVKKDGTVELFDRQKILKGLLRACEKRPIDPEMLEGMVNRMQQAFLADGRREVASGDIGACIMEELRSTDQVAYVRFASVYREFKSVDDFLAELRSVISEGGQ